MNIPTEWRVAVAVAIVTAQGIDPDELDSIAGIPHWQMLGTEPADAAILALLPLVVERCAAIADQIGNDAMDGAHLGAWEVEDALRDMLKEMTDGQ